ncbi:MFS transporter [Halocatena marina]|uniref:MFS transporter n=1 Tax=Halocatena marina TaxID=2934937 RepID=A0ABD5YKW4_9EURY|nr:MFS transporter [Halocatena marina]
MDINRFRSSRWLYVGAAVVIVGAAGTYQFAWSVIRAPIGVQAGASETVLGTVFSVMIVSQTLAAFPAGWIRDRHGPHVPLLAGSVLLTAGFAGAALMPTVPVLYLWFALGGAGVGIAYDIAVNTPSQWFVNRRGMATGAVSMAFSGTSFVLIPVIQRGAETAFTSTLLVLALAAGIASLIGAAIIRDPDGDSPVQEETPARSAVDESAVTWRSMLRTRQFWVLYLIFVVVNGVGLMLLEKVVAYAGQLGLPTAAATAAASLVALGQATGVVVLGSVSDRIGHKRTLAGSLVICGLSLAATVVVGQLAFEWLFVALAGVTMFFRSPSFAIMPGLTSQYYGQRYASENYAVLLTAKLWGGIFGGTATSVLVLSLGWSQTFYIAAALAVVAGILASVALDSS